MLGGRRDVDDLRDAIPPVARRHVHRLRDGELEARLPLLPGGVDGRVGNDTMKAVKDYQNKMGLLPADGYGGLKVLARLRQGN